MMKIPRMYIMGNQVKHLLKLEIGPRRRCFRMISFLQKALIIIISQKMLGIVAESFLAFCGLFLCGKTHQTGLRT